MRDAMKVYRFESGSIFSLGDAAAFELEVCGVTYDTWSWVRGRKKGPCFLRAAKHFMEVEAEDRLSWWNPLDPPSQYLARQLFDRVVCLMRTGMIPVRLYVTLGTELDWSHHADLLFVWGHACIGIDLTVNRFKRATEGRKHRLLGGGEEFENIILSPADFRSEELLDVASFEVMKSLLAFDRDARERGREQPFGTASQLYAWRKMNLAGSCRGNSSSWL